MLSKSPIKWRQRPDMTIAVDWDVKHQFNQTKLFGYYDIFISGKSSIKMEATSRHDHIAVDWDAEPQLNSCLYLYNRNIGARWPSRGLDAECFRNTHLLTLVLVNTQETRTWAFSLKQTQ